MSKRSDALYPIGAVLIFFVFLPAGCVWIEDGSAPFKRAWLDWFGISGEMTVAEYRQNHDLDTEVHWSVNMCNDGDCLPKTDWDCGFTLDNDDLHSEVDDVFVLVEDCFEETAKSADANITLDQVRKYCGQKYARFVGALYAVRLDPEGGEAWQKKACAKAGGVWGEPQTIWKPEDVGSE